ncbi:uncharacterized protein [Montipora foliosa]|uniref:uncharacterized protein n=1 Tax=Montipora foliosa TaxID=591990 RepID=UPI0035F13FF4
MSDLQQMVELLLSTFPVYREYARSEKLSQEFLAKLNSLDEGPRFVVTGSYREGYPDTLFSDVDTIILLNPVEEKLTVDCQRKVLHPVDEAPAHVKLIIPQSYKEEFKQKYFAISSFLDLVSETEEEGCFVSAEKTRRLNRRDFLPDCIDEHNKPSKPWTERDAAEGADLCPAYTFRTKNPPWTIQKAVESDRVPAIECMGWPYAAREWISRKPRYWPKAETVDKISTNGFMIVPKPTDISGDTRREWRLSFSIPEGVLFDTFDECHAMVYYMFRSLYVNSLKERLRGTLTSYHFKTVMFWMLEETEPSCWSRERIVDNFLCAVKKLYQFTRDGFLPHYFIPGHNLFYKTSVQALELATKEIMFAFSHPLEALEQMVTPEVVGLMPRLGLFSLDMKTKDNMKILRLPESLAYSVFTRSEPREFARKIALKSFSQTLDDTIISVKSFPENVSLINLYLPAILYGYALASAMENSAASFDATKLGVVGQDFLEMDTGHVNQSLLVWFKIVKIAVDEVIASGPHDKLLPFMKHFQVFAKESDERYLTEQGKEILGTFRTVCATVGGFLATAKFSALDIAYSHLYELLCEVLPPSPTAETSNSVDTSPVLFILGGATCKMTNRFLSQ